MPVAYSWLLTKMRLIANLRRLVVDAGHRRIGGALTLMMRSRYSRRIHCQVLDLIRKQSH